MKNIAFLSSMLLLLSACSSVQPQQQSSETIGMANPASQYCIEQGGRSEIVKEAQGEIGYCHLKNGQKIEEWTLFRQNQAQCIAEQAKKLVGQDDRDDAQLKQHTKAETIQRVAPNQPMTMDFRSDRLTLVIDPASKKILRASCG